ncbi:Obg family GTPase CgtA [Buchnera aphidicola (Taiwanaphis decaspermi)]|uniref:Obg family GTPase CgtA n=1 Tax=Buchnera aphidicola TaxID=9 RepID=UPI0031B86320
MKFIDEVYIHIYAGNGGDGCVHFRREKYIPKGGPDGGNGGNGGNVWIYGNKNISNLSDYKSKKILKAKNGNKGSKQCCSGKKGEDLIINVPLGTRVVDFNTKNVLSEILKDKQKILFLKGGYKGLGNNHFKSSINKSPKNFTKGKKGEYKYIKLELILIADVGTLGLPNAGKSTFVKNISTAKTKIDSYPFTTLNPILGLVRLKNNKKKFTIADIPGIMHNASQGYGLGLKFLKHLERCKLLLHIVDIQPNDYSNPLKNIKTIITEIYKFSKKLFLKDQWIILNKIDLLKNDNDIFYIKKNLKKYTKRKIKYYLISALYKKGIKKLVKDIYIFLHQ